MDFIVRLFEPAWRLLPFARRRGRAAEAPEPAGDDPNDNLRLLPWTGEGGKPSYLSTDAEGSFLSRLADNMESVQLGMGRDLLDHVETVLREDQPGEAELIGIVGHLCHALRDAHRVAESRGRRLPTPAPDTWSAAADAVVEREIAP